MKYKKKPVVIDAWDVEDLLLYHRSGPSLPEEVEAGYKEGLLDFEKGHINVVTLEGVMVARSGDMLVKGVQGEFYPCRKDIFRQTYERATW